MTTTPLLIEDAKIIVAMVGLPARGKSYLSNKLMRYLRVCILIQTRMLLSQSMLTCLPSIIGI